MKLVIAFAAGAMLVNVHTAGAFDSRPNTAFEQIGLNDGTAMLTAVKGNDGMLHSVVSVLDDASCDAHTASLLPSTTITFNSYMAAVTQSCSTAGTLYMSPLTEKDNSAITNIIANNQRVTVSGPHLGQVTFDTSKYGETVRKYMITK